MKKSIYISFIGILLTLNSFASHTGMMEMNYRHIAGNSYEITLLFYRNCVGSTAGAPFSIPLTVRSTSRSVNSTNAATLSQLAINGSGVPPLQPDNLMNCTNATVCFEEYVYRGVVNLNNLTTLPNANDWVFSYSLCCFPGGAWAPDNIVGGSILAECGLNNLDFPAGNDSPYWHDRRPNRPGYLNNVVINYPGTAVCANRTIEHDQSVKEYEGDIIKYEFIVPMSVPTATYLSPFSFVDPMPFATPPGLEIDSTTGIIELNATTAGVYYLGIKATESRVDTIIVSGVPTTVFKEIGFVKRNYLIFVESGTNCPDNGFAIKTKGVNLSCNDTSFTIKMTTEFDCSTADDDGSFFTIKKMGAGPASLVDSVTVSTCFYGLTAEEFEVYLNQPLSSGTYEFVIQTGGDGNTLLSECGLEYPAGQDTLIITIDSVFLPEFVGSLDSNANPQDHLEFNCGQSIINFKLNEKISCSSIQATGSDFTLIDSTKSPATVKSIFGAAPAYCTKGFTDEITIVLTSPLEEGSYELFLKTGSDGNTLLNKCGNNALSQSIPIKTEEINVDLGPDITYCKDSVFYAILNPGNGYHYQWSTGDTVQQIVVTYKGTYYVEIDNGFGCTDRDTVVVTEIDCSPWSGIEDHLNSDFILYPIPANDLVYIELIDGKKITNAKIYTQQGRLVQNHNNQNTSKLEINTIDLSDGIYFINVKDNSDTIYTTKLLIAH